MTTITRFRRDPFVAEFDSIVRGTFGPQTTTGFSPAAETTRDGDDVVVRLELPGVDVDNDVTVETTAGRLVISGERRDERDESEGRRVREFRYGSFRRSFTLPSTVAADAVTASYADGILSVRVAGVYTGSEPTRISITRAEQKSATDES